jgi:hypothetical protein
MKPMKQATESQKQAARERREKLAAMAKQIAAMPPEDRAKLAAQGVATIEGRALSLKNAMLLIMQRAQVSVVGGFRQWKQAGRIVRKGEKALALWIPVSRKETDESGAETVNPGFRIANVFDISQTEEIPA